MKNLLLYWSIHLYGLSFLEVAAQNYLACGTPPKRQQTLHVLSMLAGCVEANLAEVLRFIETKKLFGLGCGFVDLTLLASTLLTSDCKFWTLDKRLHTLPENLELHYQP